ncbi:MAG: benzoyl-CoA reductase subunit D [Crocinitomicaceae bacterium]|nr:benzoyl-CoA reductase subunit D [Crocinitomicaceae bacterium]MBK8924469.1 benzoyl-CoA reductase subunit D [Crocinitomicaceae bacterium]
MSNTIYTMGVDVGGSYVKGVLLAYDDATQKHTIVDKQTEKIRKRNPKDVVVELVDTLLERNNLNYDKDIKYLASTGEGEMVEKKTGHFYSMTTHAKGGIFFAPNAKTVVDMGGLYVRAVKVDSKGKVIDYKMTGQCASGSGQFIENISRYLGLAIEEVGEISLKADNPEVPSGICAVLAETDVINLVSKGLSTPNIVKGINLSIAQRVVKLLGALNAETPIALVGGMGMNVGMIQAVEELSQENKKASFEFIPHPDAIYSGAVGAAIWGGYRYYKLKDKQTAVVA